MVELDCSRFGLGEGGDADVTAQALEGAGAGRPDAPDRHVEPARDVGVARVGVFVLSDDAFDKQPAVANAASEFLIEIFGDAGRHARSAVGVAVLPLDSPVELELVVEFA